MKKFRMVNEIEGEDVVKEEVIVENPEENEEIEVDVTEISLSEDEINSWINQLESLRETKFPIQIELDENNELLITYDENPEYEEDDDEEDEDEEDDDEEDEDEDYEEGEGDLE